MLLILGVLYLLQGFFNAEAAPLSLFPRESEISPSLPQECFCPCPDTRSKWDIVWSCLVTVFACSWVSVHPNIPGPGEPWWKKALRRLELMFWSIISPELIIYWAMWQWLGARHLGQKYRSFNWTETHGYFIQMGGFMLYDGEKAIGVLGPEKLAELIEEEKIAMPAITEEEIQDRSKGDGLSKTIVIIQTTWFIAQCIARRVRGLIITELELVTLAFAALNVIMYVCWWNKPLDITTTIPVILLQPTPPKLSMSDEPLEGESSDVEMETCDAGDAPTLDENEPTLLQDQSMGHDSNVIKPIASELLGSEMEQENSIVPSEMQPHPPTAHNFSDFPCRILRLISGILFRWPVAGIVAVVSRMGDIFSSEVIIKGQMRVTTFYTYDPYPNKVTRQDIHVFYALPFISMLFGAIHCAGWNFIFPSLTEANIWRSSSAVITAVPAIGLVAVFLIQLNDNSDENNSLVSLSGDLLAAIVIVMLPLYVLARLALLVEALVSLRNLPSGALAAVEWISFFPHV